ncbi:MAG TPA: hypothetical protein VF676_05740 [Flavobacterium sp.]|jgi:hypothetical protein
MTNFRILTVLILSLFFSAIYSQTDKATATDQVSNSISEYFKLDREIIHLHLNKNTYLSNETIWFKGYITEKKSDQPYGSTANVYVQLLDQTGKPIKSNLHFATSSTFEGYITLDQTMPTGTYFLQAYTNFMNNFYEDESSVFRITVLNPADKKTVKPQTVDMKTAEIELFPEGGVYLQGAQNTFGVKVADCNDNGIAVTDIHVLDSRGNAVVKFSTNESGYGRFDITPQPQEIYKIVGSIGGLKAEKFLPAPQLIGATLSVNNYVFPNKSVFKIKTNTASLAGFATDSLALVLHKGTSSARISFAFKPHATEHSLVIPTEQFAEGLTTIYLVDKQLNKLSERVIFTPGTAIAPIVFNIKESRRDSITISALSPLKLGAMSISVLPSATISDTSDKSIYATLLFDNILTTPIKNVSAYIANPDRKKRFDLDNVLITKTSKYKWEDLKRNQPVEIKFPFDAGLTIKGTVNTGVSDKKDFKIKMTSLFDGDQFTTLNDKNEFFFHNLVAVDSSRIHFSLMRKERSAPLKIYPQLVNGNRTFNKAFSPRRRICTILQDVQDDYPMLENTVLLENVTVKGVIKRDTLVNDRVHGNSMARGFKITAEMATNYLDVLSFIQAHGYRVSSTGAQVTITNTYARSFEGSNTPAVFVDNSPMDDFNLLRGMNLKSIEEIYINKHGYGGGGDGALGSIRIYTKKGTSGAPDIAINSQSFLVQDGFQKWRAFENPKYDNVHNPGFQNFGTIHWIPNVNTDAQGNFTFSVPNLYQQAVKLHIEGISSDGKVISEAVTVDLR